MIKIPRKNFGSHLKIIVPVLLILGIYRNYSSTELKSHLFTFTVRDKNQSFIKNEFIKSNLKKVIQDEEIKEIHKNLIQEAIESKKENFVNPKIGHHQNKDQLGMELT